MAIYCWMHVRNAYFSLLSNYFLGAGTKRMKHAGLSSSVSWSPDTVSEEGGATQFWSSVVSYPQRKERMTCTAEEGVDGETAEKGRTEE